MCSECLRQKKAERPEAVSAHAPELSLQRTPCGLFGLSQRLFQMLLEKKLGQQMSQPSSPWSPAAEAQEPCTCRTKQVLSPGHGLLLLATSSLL